MTGRMVRSMPNGRLQIEIDKRLKDDGERVKRIRIRRVLPPGTTAAEAQALAGKLERDLMVKANAVAPADGWDDYVRQLSEAKGSWLYVTLQNCKHRAKSLGLECTLSATQIRDVLFRSRGRCEVTGLRFQRGKHEGQRTRPYFHSLDRIDSSKGYTIDNVRAVCHATNIAMNTWGEDVFAELARGYVFNRYSAFFVDDGG